MNDAMLLPPAGLMRRIAALCYDALLVFSIWMLVTLAIIAMRGGEPVTPGNLLYQLALVVATGCFFVGFWVRGGQTLGMRAWRLKVQQTSGSGVTWKTGTIRFAAGIVSTLTCGLGLFWLAVDPKGLTWHDRLAGTVVVVLPKKK